MGAALPAQNPDYIKEPAMDQQPGACFSRYACAETAVSSRCSGSGLFARDQGWGLFNYTQPPFALAMILSVIIMDGVIYLQHVMVHTVPKLWRLHRVHHADPDYDVTIGIHSYHDPRQVSWLSGILLLPFTGKITEYAINRREWSNDEK
jgi:hypothetical protein